MSLASVIKSVLKLTASSVFNAIYRGALNFDGIGIRGQLASRAINPDGDIDIEWEQRDFLLDGVVRTIVSQSISPNFASNEFRLCNVASNRLNMLIGGYSADILTYEQGWTSNGKFRVTLIGTTFTVFKNGVTVNTGTLNRGTAREPAAVTIIGAQLNGSPNYYRYWVGGVFNVKINGVLWQIADKNTNIQLPKPSGLGPELITKNVLENPAFKGSQWTYLGEGRWELNSDGSLNPMEFVLQSNQPTSGYVEFELESITNGGALTCTNSSASGSNFNSVGLCRFFYLDINSPIAFGSKITFKRNIAGLPFKCVIKNISFRELGILNPTELVANGTFSAGTAGWSPQGGGVIEVISGQLLLTVLENQNSRLDKAINVTAGVYYKFSVQIVGFTGIPSVRVSVIRGAAGNYAQLVSRLVTTGGVVSMIFMSPSTDCIVQVSRDGNVAGTITIDNVSLVQYETLCNPLTLSNVTSANWVEIIDDYETRLRKALRFDGVGVRGTFANAIELTDANPIKGKFVTGSSLPANSYLFGPNGASAFNSRIRINSDGSIIVRPTANNTDVINCPAGTIKPNTSYTFELIKSGTLYTLKLNDVVMGSGTLSGGGALFKWVGATATATTDVPIGFFSGLIYDFEAGGVKWPIADSTQSIQLPEPSGLGDELITPTLVENPAIVGTQWTYLGNGRWQYVGDGTLNILQFINSGSQPNSAYLEFEVESFSGTGSMTCATTASGNPVNPTFNTVGIKRYYFTTKGESSGNTVQFKRQSGTCSCVLKNFSFKPLGTCNPITLANATSANWEDLEI